MNTTYMAYHSIIINGYINIACYIAYDLFYLVWMLQLLHSNETNSNESQKAATRDLGSTLFCDIVSIFLMFRSLVRAVLHACASIVGFVCYSAVWIIYLLPIGTQLMMTIMSLGIHLFLNTRIEDKYLYPKQRPDRRPAAAPRTHVSAKSKDEIALSPSGGRLVIGTGAIGSGSKVMSGGSVVAMPNRLHDVVVAVRDDSSDHDSSDSRS